MVGKECEKGLEGKFSKILKKWVEPFGKGSKNGGKIGLEIRVVKNEI